MMRCVSKVWPCSRGKAAGCRSTVMRWPPSCTWICRSWRFSPNCCCAARRRWGNCALGPVACSRLPTSPPSKKRCGSLREHKPPLVVELPRQPGRKENRFAHLLAGEPAAEDGTGDHPGRNRSPAGAGGKRTGGEIGGGCGGAAGRACGITPGTGRVQEQV